MSFLKIICCFLFGISITLNIDAQRILPIKPKPGWEKWQDRVPVGADFLVGIHSNQKDESIDPSRLFVTLPKNHGPILCVSISSIDGKYKAKLEYDIKNTGSGEFEFEIPTEHKDKLSKYKTQNVAIISKSGQSCTSTNGIYHVASWNKSLEDKRYMYFGGETPVSISLFDAKGKITKVKAEKIEGVPAISYKWKCEVSQELLAKTTKIIVNRIFRSGGEAMERPENEIEVK
jgi:hypothetical protein